MVTGVGEYEQQRCPNCSSIDVSWDELKKRIASAGLLQGLPMVMVQRGWNSRACGHTWELTGEQVTDQVEPQGN